MMFVFAVLFLLSVGRQGHSIELTSSSPLRYDAPDDCQWWLRDEPDEVSLVCRLETINSDFETTNFSVIPSEYTASLRIQCNSDVMSKSSLEERCFSHLTKLRELALDHCKLGKWLPGTLYGLSDLRNLSVKTYNTDWPPMSMEVSPDSFLSVRQLERLDLSFNNIYAFPQSIFCPLTNLAMLNVSFNRLQDVGDLGFREKPPPSRLISPQDEDSNIPSRNSPLAPCSLDIQVLDASSNFFVLFPSSGFSALRRLRELRLSNNAITMVADRALAGLKNLESLDLSGNKIVALPPEVFQDAADVLKHIRLQNNSIGVLASGLFANLTQLIALDLSRNELTSNWITPTTFSGLIRLVLLNLGYNKIKTLHPSFFGDLYTLQILSLERNFIETIPVGTFAPLKNLHTLVLSFNKISTLDSKSLTDLYVLSLLSLDNNVIHTIHPDAFRNCSSLQELNLNGNLLNNTPTALHDMRLLRTVDLGENLIHDLNNPGLKGMDNLYGLRLIGNKLTNVTKDSFSKLPALQVLNLARNRISKVERGAFNENHNLQAIRLDSNLLSDITGLFNEMQGLLWLNVSDNKLQWFDYALFPQTLQWLDFHKNEVRDLGNHYHLDSELHIQTLDVSFNKLTSINAASLPNSIEILFLNDNQIRHVEPHTFLKKTNLTRVDLYANQIVSMDLNALRLAEVRDDKPLPEFYIGGNPFQCDCTMEWLQRVNSLDHLRQHPRVMDLGSIYCRLLYNRDKMYVPLIDVDTSQFLCPYKTHCFTLCQCCDFDACDCEMTCPPNCTCYHDQTWKSNIVECSGAGYAAMPSGIPMDATEVYIDGNNLVELSSHSFIGRKNLLVLYANNSNIVGVHNNTFSSLKRLRVLHLENNVIKELLGFEFSNLEDLKELYLQGNQIHYIDNRTFMGLKQIEILRLDGNRLRTFQVWQFTFNPYLVEITLGSNPWSCNCQYLQQFRGWLQPNHIKVVDEYNIACVVNNMTNIRGPSMSDYNSTTCSAFTGDSHAVIENHVIHDYLPLLLSTICTFVLCITMVCCVFYYRRELRIWIYSRCGLRMCYKATAFEEEQDRDRLFDAYISYSVKDESFVNQVLAPGLELTDPRYRLCLHYRDFNASAYVADTIIEAVESSKRTIVILSKNFLHSEWCRFEFKSALHEVLKDRRRRLIVIVLGEVPSRDLDPDLRLYLKTNKCIVWGDKWFWQKLRFAMPDVKKNTCTAVRHTRPHVSVNLYSGPGSGSPMGPPPLPPLPNSKTLPAPFLHHQNNLSQQRGLLQPLWA